MNSNLVQCGWDKQNINTVFHEIRAMKAMVWLILIMHIGGGSVQC